MSNFSPKFTPKEYENLRNYARKTIAKALCRFNADGYCWMDRSEKDDIVSDAITKALCTFNPCKKCSFYTWVSLLTWQATLDRLNSHHDTCDISVRNDEDEEFENPAFIKWETAEDEVIGWETAYRIDSALEDRSKEDRIIFNMDREGYTAPEIAAQLGIKTSNVYVRLHRTKQAVSRSLVA